MTTEDNAKVFSDASDDHNDDDVLTNLYPALTQCVFVILVGYSAGRIKLIPPGGVKGKL